MSTSFKDHIHGTKKSWDCNNNSEISNGGEDYMNGFSWPPRSYTCSFCKREFRSAQALGGHMNVHRRDRARLRQSPPPPITTTDHHHHHHHPHSSHILNLNLNPTSTLSLLSSSPSSSSTILKKPFSTTLPAPSLVSPTLSSSSSPSHDQSKKWVADGILLKPLTTKTTPESTKLKKKNAESLSGFGEYDGISHKLLKKTEIIRLDLQIGLLSDSKDDLDLELRLGTYS